MMATLIEKLDSAMSITSSLICNGKCLDIREMQDPENLNFLYDLVISINEQSSLSEISKGIDAISLPAEERFKYYSNKGNSMLYRQRFDYLSEYELSELHRLKMLLPSYLEIQSRAKEWILQRSIERKRLKQLRLAEVD